jgi:hypothetical protein
VLLAGGANGGKVRCQAFPDLGRTPGGPLLLELHDQCFDLKGQLVGNAVRSPAAIGERLDPAFLVPINDLAAAFRLRGVEAL